MRPRGRSAAGGLAGSESGQAVVEFALVAPLLFLLLFGIVEVGRAINAYLVLTSLAREGARTAAVANAAVTGDSIESLVRSGLHGASLNPAAAELMLTGIEGAPGTPARVEIVYPYRLSLFGSFAERALGSPGITLRAAVAMRNE